jgi:glycosyltransferase involved in cell wall biosynthesis
MTDQPIRVLLTVPHLTPTASPFRQMIALAHYLPREAFALTICSLTDRGIANTGPELDALGVPYFVARFRPVHKPRWRLPLNVLDSMLAHRALAMHGPFDIHHAMDYTSSPFEALMVKLTGRIFIHHQRNLNEGGSDRALRFKARLTDHFIANTDATAAFLQQTIGVPAACITRAYNGIDVDAFDAQIADPAAPDPAVPELGPNYILSVGHVQRRKRHEVAIRALAAVLDRVPEARLGIAGHTYDKAYKATLDQLAADLGVSDRMDFLGVRTDVPLLMKRVGAFLLCTESEAFGWTVLEAMTAGTPVVASGVGGILEIVIDGETGHLAPVGDADAFADALARVLTDADHRAQICAAARQRAEDVFSARAMVNQIADLYRRLAAHK